MFLNNFIFNINYKIISLYKYVYTFYIKNKNSNWPLLIATNRDRFYDREFDDPGFYWEQPP